MLDKISYKYGRIVLKKFISIIILLSLLILLISCSNNNDLNNIITQPISVDSEASAADSATEQNKELIEKAKDTENVQIYLQEYESEELNHHPDFKECSKSRSKVGGRGGGNTFDYNLCIYDNMRTLVNTFFESINTSNLDNILKVLDEDSKSTVTKLLEDKINKFSTNNSKLTWMEESEPRKTGSRNMSMYINISQDENSIDRWLISFTELGKKGSGLWVIKSVQENQ